MHQNTQFRLMNSWVCYSVINAGIDYVCEYQFSDGRREFTCELCQIPRLSESADEHAKDDRHRLLYLVCYTSSSMVSLVHISSFLWFSSLKSLAVLLDFCKAVFFCLFPIFVSVNESSSSLFYHSAKQ